MQLNRLSAVLVIVALCSFAFTQQALAWGSCNRGPWVYSGSSACSCSNGQAGSGYESGGTVYLSATAGPTNGWVALEYEAYDLDGNRVFVPAATYAFWQYEAIWAANYSSISAPKYTFPWAAGYSFTGRYHSVCLTNYTNFTYPDDEAWGY